MSNYHGPYQPDAESARIYHLPHNFEGPKLPTVAEQRRAAKLAEIAAAKEAAAAAKAAKAAAALAAAPKAPRKARVSKYASAAEKQAAYRARHNGEQGSKLVQVRLTGKTPAFVEKLAEQNSMSVSEVINQMLKFAAANRDWMKVGVGEESDAGMTAFAHPDARFANGKKGA